MTTPSGSAPRIIGRYALYDAIASGGMATVHLGRLLGAVGFARTVAIKRLHPHLVTDPEIVAMLVDEARLVARIRHPNVVPTLDVVSEDGELFLVMEYVQGESLARLVRAPNSEDGRIPSDIVGTIFVGILHGLHAAHEARGERGELLGIVHRDVSPQNILVGVDGIPRLVDFGVAKAAGRVGEATRDGQIKGKLAYMAPEQVRGTTDRTTDIYAASVVLWEALTGRRLFAGATDMEIFSKVMEGSATPPSSFVPGLPPIFDTVTLRGLDRDPAKRYQTAREMARELEAALTLVVPSRIGEWVENAAKAVLDDRAKRMEAIESDSAMKAPAVADLRAPRLSDPDVLVTVTAPLPEAGPAATGLAATDDPPSTQLSSVSERNVVATVAPQGKRSMPLLTGALVIAVVALGVVGAFLLRPHPSAQLQGASASPPSHSPSAPSSDEPSTSPPGTASPVVAMPPSTSTSTAPELSASAVPPHSPVGTSPHPAGEVAPANTPATRPHAPPPPSATAASAPVTPVPAVRVPAKDDSYDHM